MLTWPHLPPWLTDHAIHLAALTAWLLPSPLRLWRPLMLTLSSIDPAQARQLGQAIAATVQLALGVVEGLMPGADAATRRAALAALLAPRLRELETQAGMPWLAGLTTDGLIDRLIDLADGPETAASETAA